MKRVLCTSLLGAALLGPGCKGDPETEVVHGTAVDHGKALFEDPSIANTSFNSYACASCHEPQADDSELALPGAPMAGVLGRPDYWGGKERELLDAIDHCLYYFMLRDQPLAKDDEEARALYAYLESLSPGGVDTPTDAAPFTVPVKVEDVPAGDASAGAGAYAAACALCHGDAHTGSGRLVDRAPVLPEDSIADHPSPGYSDAERRLVFIEKVRHGGFLGYTGQMPPLSMETLSDEDLGHVLAYLGL
ncbi:MAG: c-type cytochrome [Polyangiaceae bacterium]